MRLGDDTRVRFVDGEWDVAFKKPRGRRLRWIRVTADDAIRASRAAAQLVAARLCEFQGWLEYGISRATVVETRVTVYSSKGIRIEWRPS